MVIFGKNIYSTADTSLLLHHTTGTVENVSMVIFGKYKQISCDCFTTQ